MLLWSLHCSPGIVFAEKGSAAEFALRNCVKIEDLEDPVTPVGAILEKCDHDLVLPCFLSFSFFSTYFDFFVFVSFLFVWGGGAVQTFIRTSLFFFCRVIAETTVTADDGPQLHCRLWRNTLCLTSTPPRSFCNT